MQGNKLETPLTLMSLRGTFQEKALLDSRAMENFINDTTVEWLKLGTTSMGTSVMLRNIDRTSNKLGKIMQFLNLQVAKGNKKATQRFFVSHLKGDRIILGFPWLEKFNPEIDWPT